MFSQKHSLLLNTVFCSFVFLLLLKSRVKTTFDMCGFIDEVLMFLLLNSFTRKNKPRPVKGHGLVYSLLLRYPNN